MFSDIPIQEPTTNIGEPSSSLPNNSTNNSRVNENQNSVNTNSTSSVTSTGIQFLNLAKHEIYSTIILVL